MHRILFGVMVLSNYCGPCETKSRSAFLMGKIVIYLIYVLFHYNLVKIRRSFKSLLVIAILSQLPKTAYVAIHPPLRRISMVMVIRKEHVQQGLSRDRLSPVTCLSKIMVKAR